MVEGEGGRPLINGDGPSSTYPALEIDDLWKIYGRNSQDIDIDDDELLAELTRSGEVVVAVKSVFLTVEACEVFVVMGLSGSGKSTLIRCLLRLVEPTSGRIVIGGEEVTTLGEKELARFRRRQAAMVFQHYGLLPHRTVLENVALGLKIKGMDRAERKEKAREALEKVGLDKWARYYPGSLSGGMRQRVGIARAIVMDSPLLLMDEPFSGLDPLIRREMQDELLRLQEELHRTIFFVTHDLDEAMRLGNKMAVMKNGEVVQQGTPEAILADPADAYVARFVDDKRRQVDLADRKKTAMVKTAEGKPEAKVSGKERSDPVS